MIKLVCWLTLVMLRHMTRKRTITNYDKKVFKFDKSDCSDYPILLASKLARGCDTIIEIGAGNGNRIINVKRNTTDAYCVGMDIGPSYDAPCLIENVFFNYLSNDIPSKSFVFCVGTLSYMNRIQLHNLMMTLIIKKCSLLIFEPEPPFVIRTPIARHSDCWYYPYEAMMKEYGFKCTKFDWFNGSLKNFENWHCGFYQL